MSHTSVGARQTDAGEVAQLRGLGAREVQRIRAIVRSRPGLTRGEIAEAVCRAFGWRRPNGALRVRACRDVLVRLAERGRIELPAQASRRAGPRDVRSAACEGAEPAVLPGRSEPVELRRIVVRAIGPGELAAWRETMARHHYLGDGEIVGETVRHVAEADGRWVALVAWGAAAWKSRHREAWIGWDVATKYRRLHLVTNNVRFLVLPDARVPHLASAVLARSVRRLSRDFEARYGHPVLVAETFVDIERFAGTCYLAANWRRLGETRGMARKGRGYEAHGKKKALFVIELERRAREHLAAPMLSPQILRRMAMAKLPAAVVNVNDLPLDGEGGLMELLRQVPDPRKKRGCRHRFAGILAVCAMASLSGMRGYEPIAEWAAELPREMLGKMGFWRWEAPSESTIRRSLTDVDAEAVERLVNGWLAGLVEKGAIAIDGKTLRGSADGEKPAVHLLAAITHGEGVVVAQRSVEEKSNEIPGAAPLLADIDLRGTTVTADALHTQRGLAEHLVAERGADYVLIAKDNQPKLLATIEGVAWKSIPPSGSNDRPGARTDRGAHDPDHG